MAKSILLVLVAATACKLWQNEAFETKQLQQKWRRIGVSAPDYTRSVFYFMRPGKVLMQYVFYLGKTSSNKDLVAGAEYVRFIDQQPLEPVSLYDSKGLLKLNVKAKIYAKIDNKPGDRHPIIIWEVRGMDFTDYPALTLTTYADRQIDKLSLTLVSLAHDDDNANVPGRRPKNIAGIKLRFRFCAATRVFIGMNTMHTGCTGGFISLLEGSPVFDSDTGEVLGLHKGVRGEIDLFSAKFVQQIRDIQGLGIDAKDKKHSVLGEIKTEQ